MLGIGGFHQELVVKAGGLVVQLLDSRNALAFSVGLRVVGTFDNSNTGALGQFLDGIEKGEVLVLHDKADSAAAFPTAEAFVALPGRIDSKRWAFFVVERTVGLEEGSGPLEGEIAADEIDNICRGKDLLDSLFRNAAHGRD